MARKSSVLTVATFSADKLSYIGKVAAFTAKQGARGEVSVAGVVESIALVSENGAGTLVVKFVGGNETFTLTFQNTNTPLTVEV